jgi:hypothetical protein
MIHAQRLSLLEHHFAVRASCPHCRDWPEPLLLRGTQEPSRVCPVCGRQPTTIRLVRCDFYHNADRLLAIEWLNEKECGS